MILKSYIRWIAIAGIVSTAIALISWGRDTSIGIQSDSLDDAASIVRPLTSMPVEEGPVNGNVQFDLYFGSGFLIKDCGANGVDIGHGIHRGDIIVRRKDVDLHVSRTSGTEQVICTHFFSEFDNSNKAIRFADGSKVDYYDIVGN